MIKILRISILPLLLAFALSQQSCGTTVVAKGQQSVHAGAVSFDSFVTFEKANRAALFAINPAIKHSADKLRHRECDSCDQNGVKWLESSWNLVEVYRTHRTPENKANMDTAIAVIQDLINEISNYFLDPHVAALDPMAAVTYKKTKVIP